MLPSSGSWLGVGRHLNINNQPKQPTHHQATPYKYHTGRGGGGVATGCGADYN
jgi:hypothetical protein